MRTRIEQAEEKYIGWHCLPLPSPTKYIQSIMTKNLNQRRYLASLGTEKNLHDKVVRANRLKEVDRQSSTKSIFSRYLQKRRAGEVLWNLSFSHCTSQSATIDLEIAKGWLQQPDHHQGSQQESKGGDKWDKGSFMNQLDWLWRVRNPYMWESNQETTPCHPHYNVR